MGDLNLVRSPINLSSFPQPDHFDRAAPDTGQDSVEVLTSFGIERARIDALIEAGTIGA